MKSKIDISKKRTRIDACLVTPSLLSISLNCSNLIYFQWGRLTLPQLWSSFQV